MIIKLPFPAAELFPNRKNGKHWAVTSAIRQAQKDAAYWSTKASGAFECQSVYIPLSLLFVAPDKRHRDCDNMLAAAKALLDGVALALGVDDSRFKPVLVDWVHGTDKQGALVVAVGVQIQSGVNL